ncbi:hypothetical protein [Gracilibacillus sp. YIM 98692]|uniref:hypothetical protein n=1 Tax=Gracilibacillus sp. YIM 98692 TaxID=2663532 RepID=UPI0013D05375|nr:hypothetical protein [Gracilibacillus sp. YIM 98692]
MEDIKERILTGIALILSFCFAVSIWALTIQYIGVDDPNKATIISGLLSMLGGMVGAFAAYLIARAQITEQLDLQDKKDRSRVLLEIRLRKAEEILDILTRTRMTFFSLHGTWTSVFMDYSNYIESHWTEDVKYEDMKNEKLLEALDKQRDEFIKTYSECYKFKPYFPDLITNIEKEHNDFLKDLTLGINAVVYRFSGVDYTYKTYKELWESIETKISDVNANFEKTLELIDQEIVDTEKEISHLLQNFNERTID